MRAQGMLNDQELLSGGGRFSAGDRVIVKRNDSRCDVRNGDRGIVDTGAGSLRVRFGDRLTNLDAEFLVKQTREGRPAIEHGYAITAYAAQGMTCRHALVLTRDEAYAEWIYTTMTRASDANRLYVIADRSRGRDEFAPGEPGRDGRVLLAAAITNSRADELAIQRLQPTDRSLGREL